MKHDTTDRSPFLEAIFPNKMAHDEEKGNSTLYQFGYFLLTEMLTLITRMLTLLTKKLTFH